MKWINIFLCLFFTVSCSTHIEEYKLEKPNLLLENFFNGKLLAHGFFKDRSNKVTKRFVVSMKASWVNNVGTLDEDFTYSDGTKSKRVWTLTKIGENLYEGTASDVIGKAIGKIAGNSLYWSYDLKLKVDQSEYIVHFEDWMYLIDNGTLLNQSYMSKFGFSLGEVVLSMRKVE